MKINLKSTTLLVSSVALGLLSGGCANEPAAKRTGFLSSYDSLKADSDDQARYVSPRLAEYNAYIIDPVQVSMSGRSLSPEDRAAAAVHFRSAFIKAVKEQDLTVTDTVGPKTARVRLALTDVAESTWWKKIHPVSRVAGAGTGGAAMEGEVIDSVTGEQLGAVVQAGTGNQFNFVAFSTLADVKSAIDKWAEQAGKRLKELRTASK